MMYLFVAFTRSRIIRTETSGPLPSQLSYRRHPGRAPLVPPTIGAQCLHDDASVAALWVICASELWWHEIGHFAPLKYFVM
jgi:hypothetical protein